ncbi:tyrosine phosphatase domain-containing protein [Rhizobium phage RHph_Y1_11]|nr:tyrosine phosphatase domain-containing protein [Rhizobium phage RHph_Y1_11]
MAAKHKVEMNGTLALPLGAAAGHTYMFLLGGPFETSLQTGDTYRVNLKAEGTRRHFDAELPIEDYSVPDSPEMVRETIEDVILQALTGKLIVTGCMGGMGRTGLFLAILAKAVGIPNPVGYVRANYFSHAVETVQQKRYVDEYDASWVPAYIAETYRRLHPIPETDMAEPKIREGIDEFGKALDAALRPTAKERIRGWWDWFLGRK